MVLGIVLFFAALLFVILLHEAGHFATAKLFGMRVDRFFVGFGPTLWSVRRGETEYGVKALPLGGFCKIAGMGPGEEAINFLERDHAQALGDGPNSAGSASDQTQGGAVAPMVGARQADVTDGPSRLFRDQPAWQRAIVLVSGAATHFVVAFFLLYAVLSSVGLPTTTTQIAAVETRLPSGQVAPAHQAGLRPGERILAVNGVPVSTVNQLRSALFGTAGEPTRVTVRGSGGGVHMLHLVPTTLPGGGRQGFIGVVLGAGTRPIGVGSALHASAADLGSITATEVGGLGSAVSSLQQRFQAPSASGSAGGSGGAATTPPSGVPAVSAPQGSSAGSGGGGAQVVGLIGLLRLAGQAVGAQQWTAFVLLLAEFNVVIGVMNLLPLPPLDGGYVALLVWEKVTGHAIDLRRVAPVAAFVVLVMVTLVVSVAWLDLTHPVANPFK